MLLFLSVHLEQALLVQAGGVAQQVVEEVARLETLDAMKQRCRQTVAVVVLHRLEAVHVAEVELRQPLTIVEDVPRAEVPLEETVQLQVDDGAEELVIDAAIEALEPLALNPRGEEDAIT